MAVQRMMGEANESPEAIFLYNLVPHTFAKRQT